MRRAARFILAAAALLGVALIVMSFSARARTVLLHLRHRDGDTHDFLVIDAGSVIVARQQLTALTPGARADASEFGKLQLTLAPARGPGVFSTMSIDPYTHNRRHGLTRISFGPAVLGNGSMRVNCQAAGAPMWAIGSVLLLPWTLTTAWAARSYRRRARRLRAGMCARCGYDLRASGEFCPECGGSNPAWQGAPT
jgi:hypothetical protein